MPRYTAARRTAAPRPPREPDGPLTWDFDRAKAGFGEVVRRARTEGPRRVTIQGDEAVVVIAAETLDKLLPSRKPRQNPVDFLRGLDIGDLDLTRERDTGRDIAL
jgi:prevent-host-death family protein